MRYFTYCEIQGQSSIILHDNSKVLAQVAFQPHDNTKIIKDYTYGYIDLNTKVIEQIFFEKLRSEHQEELPSPPSKNTGMKYVTYPIETGKYNNLVRSINSTTSLGIASNEQYLNQLNKVGNQAKTYVNPLIDSGFDEFQDYYPNDPIYHPKYFNEKTWISTLLRSAQLEEIALDLEKKVFSSKKKSILTEASVTDFEYSTYEKSKAKIENIFNALKNLPNNNSLNELQSEIFQLMNLSFLVFDDQAFNHLCKLLGELKQELSFFRHSDNQSYKKESVYQIQEIDQVLFELNRDYWIQKKAQKDFISDDKILNTELNVESRFHFKNFKVRDLSRKKSLEQILIGRVVQTQQSEEPVSSSTLRANIAQARHFFAQAQDDIKNSDVCRQDSITFNNLLEDIDNHLIMLDKIEEPFLWEKNQEIVQAKASSSIKVINKSLHDLRLPKDFYVEFKPTNTISSDLKQYQEKVQDCALKLEDKINHTKSKPYKSQLMQAVNFIKKEHAYMNKEFDSYQSFKKYHDRTTNPNKANNALEKELNKFKKNLKEKRKIIRGKNLIEKIEKTFQELYNSIFGHKASLSKVVKNYTDFDLKKSKKILFSTNQVHKKDNHFTSTRNSG